MDLDWLLSSALAHGSGPAQRRLHLTLRTALQDGTLSAGTRLPATRVLARELGVARNSVVYAYEQLASEGLIVSDRRGSVVAPLLAQAHIQAHMQAYTQALATPASNPTASTAVPASTSPLSARAQAALPSVPVLEGRGAFTPGVPALEAFPRALWQRALDHAWRDVASQPEALNYADPLGEWPLRQAIAEHLRTSRGARCQAEHIIITDGTQASLDLCAHALADVGDTVWMERPGYGGALAAWQGAQLRIQGIPVDTAGMVVPTIKTNDMAATPRLVYTTPSHQYPTGAVMPLERRLALLALARQVGAWIIEDDYDSEFRHDGPPLPAMQGLQEDAPVIYLGTFSKTLFPALRLGYLVVPTALVTPLRQWLARTAPRGRQVEQLALAAWLRQGVFARHLRRMRRLYRQRRDALVSALHQAFGPQVSLHGTDAGMHLVIRFEDPTWDDQALSARAAAAGLVTPALSALSEHIPMPEPLPGCGLTPPAAPSALPWRGLLLGYAQVPAADMATHVACLRQLSEIGRSVM